jgi:short-subunit dehydrogenase
LSRLVLPGMIERRQGHIINISSLAGRAGPAFQEPYAATKAALVGFTSSLRSTYRGTGVSASVVTPCFVEAGIYTHLKEKTHCSAPALLGTSPPQDVAKAVIRCIESDVPEIIVNRIPVRPLLALTALSPRIGEWVINKIGTNEFFRRAVDAQKNGSKS